MLTREDLSQIQKLIRDSLFEFWEQIIEPVMVTKDEFIELKGEVGVVKGDLQEVKDDVGVLKEDVGLLKEDMQVVKEDLDNVKTKVNSIDRKLDAEVDYHDRMEKRVKKIETKVGLE